MSSSPMSEQPGRSRHMHYKYNNNNNNNNTSKTTTILTKVFYNSGPNLVTLAWMGHKLSRGEAKGWHTNGQSHTQTDAGDDNTRRPQLASVKNFGLLLRALSINIKRRIFTTRIVQHLSPWPQVGSGMLHAKFSGYFGFLKSKSNQICCYTKCQTIQRDAKRTIYYNFVNIDKIRHCKMK